MELNKMGYKRAGKTVTNALRPLLTFCAALMFTQSSALHLEHVHYTADTDVLKVTWFQEMMSQVP